MMIVCLPVMSLAQSTELTCWTTKGRQMKLTVENNNLKIPDNVAAIDLCGLEDVALDCSSASPNCLYYTDGATSVEGLPNANVVCEGVCEGLLLTDEACFYCPMDFFATDAMLRFTPRYDDEDEEVGFRQTCHETVMLPFDADFVVPEDVNGPMPEGWLQTAIFLEYNYDMLLFNLTYEECIKAYTPYLVTFAYGAYGTHILFCGQNKTVERTKKDIFDDEPTCFKGVTMSEEEASEYYRYYRGQEPYFIHTGDGMPMEPFRCFIATYEETVPSGEDCQIIMEYIVFGEENGEEESDGIDTRSNNRQPNDCYDLQGRQLPKGRSKEGFYITGGVKVIK